jgi:hypothetical protein
MSKLQYEVFLRSHEFERAAADARMRPLDWRLLLALDGRATLGDLAQRLLLDVDEAVEAIALCERLGMVVRRRVSLGEYRSEFEAQAADETLFPPEVPAEFEPVIPETARAEIVAFEEPQPYAVATEPPAFEDRPRYEEPVSYEERHAFHEAAPPAEPRDEFLPQDDPAPYAGHDSFIGGVQTLGEASEARLAAFHEQIEHAAPEPFNDFTIHLPSGDLPAATPEPQAAEPAATAEEDRPAFVLPDEPAQSAVAAAAKPIEFKLRPSVQVVIR